MIKGCFAFQLLSAGECAVESTSMLQSVAVGAVKAHDHVAREGHTQRLAEASKKLESTYSALLQKVVKHGKSDPTAKHAGELEWETDVSNNIFNAVIEQLDELEAELEGEKNQNQQLIDAAQAAMAQVNTARGTAFDRVATGVIARAAAVDTKRGAHSTCRGQEDTAITTARTSCTAFTDAENGLSRGEMSHAKWWLDADLEEGVTPDQGTKEAIQLAAGTCVTNEGLMDDKCAECDVAQRAFGAAFCSYEQEVGTTCNTHDTNWATADGDYDTEIERVGLMETSQKQVLLSVQKVRCFIEKLQKAGDEQLTETDLTDCTDAGVRFDASKLSTTPKTKPTKDECWNLATAEEGYANVPGEQAWDDAELTTFRNTANLADKIEEPLACTVHEWRVSNGQNGEIAPVAEKVCSPTEGDNAVCSSASVEFQFEADWVDYNACFALAQAQPECRRESGAINGRDGKCNCLRKNRVCEPLQVGGDAQYATIACAVPLDYGQN